MEHIVWHPYSASQKNDCEQCLQLNWSLMQSLAHISSPDKWFMTFKTPAASNWQTFHTFFALHGHRLTLPGCSQIQVYTATQLNFFLKWQRLLLVTHIVGQRHTYTAKSYLVQISRTLFIGPTVDILPNAKQASMVASSVNSIIIAGFPSISS